MNRKRSRSPSLSSPPKRWKSSSSCPQTPYTPYPPKPFDSPTNPFGRKRTQKLIHALPPVTSFSKHVALRLQLVRRGLTPRQGGVYRIVQVPLNYTFTHLRCLISFLYATHGDVDAYGKDNAYMFEVKSKATLYSPLYKPGQIKSGTTTVKLSNVRDPCRWRAQYGYGYESEEDELDEDPLDDLEEVMTLEEMGETLVEEQPGQWRWEDEEDYTVSHVWPNGLDKHRGVIYHHSQTTQVHITINDTSLPRRAGFSNVPYVFTGRGRVFLSPRPLPRPSFSISPEKGLGKGILKPKSGRVLRSSVGSIPLEPEVDLEVGDQDKEAKPEDDTDLHQDNMHSFDPSHPFFTHSQSQSKSQLEVILVEDSDDELSQPKSHSQTSSEDDEESSIEDINKTIDPTRLNKDLEFAMYLFRFMGCPGGIDLEALMGVGSVWQGVKVESDDFENDFEKVEDAVNEEVDGDEEDQDDDDEGDQDQDQYQVEEVEQEQGEEEEGEEEEYSDEDTNSDDASSHPTSSPVPPPSPFLPSSTPGLTHSSSPASSIFPSSPYPHPLDSLSASIHKAKHKLNERGKANILFPPSCPSSPSQVTLSALDQLDRLHYPHDTSTFVLEQHYPNTKYTFTPAPPPNRALRMRMERVERRMRRRRLGVQDVDGEQEEDGQDANVMLKDARDKGKGKQKETQRKAGANLKQRAVEKALKEKREKREKQIRERQRRERAEQVKRMRELQEEDEDEEEVDELADEYAEDDDDTYARGVSKRVIHHRPVFVKVLAEAKARVQPKRRHVYEEDWDPEDPFGDELEV